MHYTSTGSQKEGTSAQRSKFNRTLALIQILFMYMQSHTILVGQPPGTAFLMHTSLIFRLSVSETRWLLPQYWGTSPVPVQLPKEAVSWKSSLKLANIINTSCRKTVILACSCHWSLCMLIYFYIILIYIYISYRISAFKAWHCPSLMHMRFCNSSFIFRAGHVPQRM